MPERLCLLCFDVRVFDLTENFGFADQHRIQTGRDAEEMFRILLSCANTTDFHTKKGIGWAAKTISKFHPEIISKYSKEIYENAEVKQWFKTKIKIGLGRVSKYGTIYTS